MGFKGRYYINGIDLFEQFGIGVTRQGIAELQRLPARKEQFKRVFNDRNGTDRAERYGARILFEEKELSLPFSMLYENRQDYLQKYNSFIDFLLKGSASGYFKLYCDSIETEYTLLYNGNSEQVLPDVMTLADDHGVMNFSIQFVEDDTWGRAYAKKPEVYGVMWNINNRDSKLTKVGNSQSHVELPVHKLLRGCLLSDTGVVNYYLDADDWSKKEDGTASVLDGTDGDVMVEMPDMYFTFIESRTHRSIYVSRENNGGKFFKKRYVSAYEPTLDRTSNTMRSVMNDSDDFKGNTTAKGNLAPLTNVSRTTARTYARKRAKYELMDITTYNILVWLYYIEYGDRNSQLPVPNGLGNGLTNVVSADWTAYNNLHGLPVIGKSNSLGNKSGEVPINIAEFPDVMMNKYRGIENFFGNVVKLLDGIQLFRDFENNTFNSYISENPLLWNDTNHIGFEFIGEFTKNGGYITDINFPYIVPKTSTGGSSITYFCDNSYAPASVSEYKWFGVGGHGNSGAYAGVAFSAALHRVANALSIYGFRLCFLP